MEHIKCVVVGDGAVGKTCLLLSYTMNLFGKQYTPTVFDNYATNVLVDGHQINLQLWDTAGQEDYSRFRLLSYGATDVFLVCFALNSMISFENVWNVWIPEVRQTSGSVPIFLAGLKMDLLEGKQDCSHGNAKQAGVDYVSMDMIQAKCESHKIAGYCECSALKGSNVGLLFETVIRTVISPKPSGMDVIDSSSQGHCCLLL
jgi:Ras-related C3 botulinum toxin substrate 1